ncbi:MAG: SurA N-terminal domain-containing protein [Acidobacteriota bacterium]
MLKFLNKRDRSRKALLIIFVAALSVGLIGFFAPGMRSGLGLDPSTGEDDDVVAKVLNRKVKVKDLRTSLNLYGQQMSMGQGNMQQQSLSTVYDLYGQTVMDNLIRRELIQYEAEQYNFGATDDEVRERLKQVFSPWPGIEQYRARLQQAGTNEIEFEQNLRASIMEEKLRAYISAAAQVTPQEVEDDYRRTNTQYTFRWVEVEAAKYRPQVTVNDADLQNYFNQNKADFYISGEQRKARYVFIDQAKAGEAVQISDDELKNEFQPENHIKQVRVSEIVLNIPKKTDAKPAAGTTPAPTPDAEVQKKADDIVKRAKGEDGKAAEDFAKLARELSEDAKTKASGGDLGYLNKDDKRESDDPLNRVFTMAKDEVSAPIRKGDKFYILKVTDRKLPSFEEAKAQLLKEARTRKGYSKGVEIADEALAKYKETKNASAVADEINKKYGAGVATVKETPLFVKGESIADLGAYSDVDTALFDMKNPGDISERLNVNNGFAVAEFIEKRDAHDPAFEEVKAKVEDKYRQAKARELALTDARKIAQAATPDAMKAAGDAVKATTDERAGMTANDSIGAVVNEGQREPVYKLKAGEVVKDPIKIDDGDRYVVVAAVSRKDPDMGEAFQKERRGIEDKLLQSKRSDMFQAYLDGLKKQLTDAGKIVIYEEPINALLASDTSGGARTPGSGGTPLPGGTTRRPTRRPPNGGATQ